MYEPAGRQFPYLAFLWPAFAAAAAGEMAALAARQFADFAVGPPDSQAPREPQWTTPHAIALELKTVRLRDFSTDDNSAAALICAPLALHGAALTDFAPGHSLVAALRGAGLRRLFVTDWRSATAEMRFLGIDDYLADLNVLVDEVGGPVDLVGLCQGGWMALLYAARFPTKVRKLVLAGAPIDIQAGASALSALAETSPLAMFRELVRLGDGCVPGRKVLKFWGPEKVLKFWGPESVDAEDVRQLLQTAEPAGSAAFARLEVLFQEWYSWTLDLPGRYFLEVVEKLYKRNELATGALTALGQPINLAAVTAPIFLLAARDDELVAPPQLFAAEHLVGTSAHNMRKALAPCRHVGLFMGKTILDDVWPSIGRWLGEPRVGAPHQTRSRQPNLPDNLGARLRSNRPGALRSAGRRSG
jgi:poly(3-hydroxyalkanoate) synthetase